MSNATSKVAGAHNLRFGFQAQWRDLYQDTTTGARGGFTFNGRATGGANNRGERRRRLPARLLLDLHRPFGGVDSTYMSPTFAPFIDDVWQASATR